MSVTQVQNSHELMITGFGGQGVLTIGELLVNAAFEKYEYISWLPSYDTFRRGGRVVCYVVISQSPIASPLLSDPPVLIVMDNPSLDLYQEIMAPEGIMILDSSLIDPARVSRKDIHLVSIPSSQLAQEIETNKISNLVLLGAYLRLTKALPLGTVEAALAHTLQQVGKDGLLPMNREALKCGYDWVGKLGVF